MKHKVQISIDEALRSLGEAARDCHDLSLGQDALQEEWGANHDQLMAATTMLIGIRYVVTDTVGQQLLADKEHNKKKHKKVC